VVFANQTTTLVLAMFADALYNLLLFSDQAVVITTNLASFEASTQDNQLDILNIVHQTYQAPLSYSTNV